jgi:DNA repair exonuclease SbcCD ATPase subunit
MDVNHIAKRVSWLDEERRRDKDEIARLQSILDAQAEDVRDQARHIQELERRLASVQTQFATVSAVDRALQQFKDEIVLFVERQEEQLQEKARDAARLQLIEQDRQAKQFGEIHKDLQRLPRLEEEMNLRRAEDQRLGGEVIDLQHKLEELDQTLETRLRNVTYLEEQRTRDARRVAQLQEETTDLLKRQEAQGSRVQSLEEVARRNEHRLGEMDASEAEHARQRREFAESLQRGEQAREQQMFRWRETMESLQQRMDKAAEQMRRHHEQYMESKRMLEDLQKLEGRLKQGYAEVTELQRLAEARQRTKLEEAQAENEKRWKKQTLLWEQQWRDHDRRNDEQLGRIAALEKLIQFHTMDLATLWEIEEAHARVWANQSQEWAIHVGDRAAKLQQEKKKP